MIERDLADVSVYRHGVFSRLVKWSLPAAFSAFSQEDAYKVDPQDHEYQFCDIAQQGQGQQGEVMGKGQSHETQDLGTGSHQGGKGGLALPPQGASRGNPSI